MNLLKQRKEADMLRVNVPFDPSRTGREAEGLEYESAEDASSDKMKPSSRS